MKIDEIFMKNEMQVEVNRIKKCSCVDIGFTNNDGIEDETELTVRHSLRTYKGMRELRNLFASLVKEFDTTEDSVAYVRIIASADTEAELEAMGY